MASSIEPEFNPPDDLSREEVIRMAQHYVNYWKIECNSYVYKYMQSLNDLHKAKNRTEELWEVFKKIYKEKSEWQPIETAPKDEYIIGYDKTHGEKMCCWYWHENTNDQLEEGWIYYYGCASYRFYPKKWKHMTIDNNQLKGFPPNNEK